MAAAADAAAQRRRQTEESGGNAEKSGATRADGDAMLTKVANLLDDVTEGRQAAVRLEGAPNTEPGSSMDDTEQDSGPEQTADAASEFQHEPSTM